MFPVRKILVVDDEPDFRFLLRHIFTEAGYGVVEAADGQQGLETLESARPDLLVVDWNMPKINGVEFCRQVRQSPAFHSIPIIMLTVRRQDTDQAEGLHCGADFYCVKPIEPEELLLRVKGLFKAAQ